MKNNRIVKIKFWILIFLVFLSLVFSIYAKIKGIHLEDINFMERVHEAPIFFIIFYTAVSFIPIPFAPTMFLAAFVFPFFQAVFYTTLGSLIFSTLAFWIARFLGKDYLDYLESKNKKLKLFDLKIREDPIENLMLLRLFFVIPGEIINVFAGMSKIKYKHFIISSLIGVIPVIICSIGFMRGYIKHDTISIILSAIGFGVLLIVPLFFSSKLRRVYKTPKH